MFVCQATSGDFMHTKIWKLLLKSLTLDHINSDQPVFIKLTGEFHQIAILFK